MRPAWLPDWRDDVVLIAASGPSMRDIDLSGLAGRVKVIAIKRTVEKAPWADLVYGCDFPWWRHVRGLPEFTGIKVGYDPLIRREFPDIHLVEIDPKDHALRFESTGRLGSGGNSGFQALGIAIQAGARRIVLAGFDMNDRTDAHWYGRNVWFGANNPTEQNYRTWLQAYAAAAPRIAERGIEVVNVSRWTALTAFPRWTMEQTEREWL